MTNKELETKIKELESEIGKLREQLLDALARSPIQYVYVKESHQPYVTPGQLYPSPVWMTPQIVRTLSGANIINA